MGLSNYNMKLSGDLEKDMEKLALFRELVVNRTTPDKDATSTQPGKSRLRVDANNLWGDNPTLAID